MSQPNSERDRLARAESLLAAFATRADAADVTAFEALVGAHPDLERELRELHAAGAALDVALDAGRREHDRQRAQIAGLLAQLDDSANTRGRYELEGEVGKGGMGVVYRVRDRRFGRSLAMKVVLGQADVARTGRTPSVPMLQLARFVNEARVTGQLEHPGIVPVHEVGIDADGRVFFTMKLVQGLTLADVFARGAAGDAQWPTPRILGVIERVCDALAFAHRRGVIHRDLKPSNVMVGDFGEVYVMDWGLARRLDDTTADPAADAAIREQLGAEVHRTREGAVLGTPSFMSPEQARGEIAAMGPRTDVYAVGAMLYQLIAGHAPYVDGDDGSSAEQILTAIRQGPPARLRSRSSPAELIAIADKAMAYEQADRYASVRELADDLRRLLDGRSVRAFRTGAWVDTKKWVQRNRALAGALFATLLASSLGTVVALRYANEALASGAIAAARATENAELARRNGEMAQAEASANQAAQASAVAATQRAAELEQVAAFQDSQLSGIDVDAMGMQLRRAIITANAADRQADVEAALADVNFTDVALHSLDETVFQRAQQAIQASFADQPSLRARLLLTVGETMSDLGLLEGATAPMAEALAIRQVDPGVDDRSTLATQQHMGVLLMRQGKLADSERCLRDACDRSRRVLGSEDRDTVHAILNLGETLNALSRYAEAEVLLQEAIDTGRRVFADDPKALLACVGSLGDLLLGLGRWPEAEPLLREAMDQSRTVNGATHHDTLAATANYGGLLGQLGRQADGEQLLRDSLRECRAVLGNDHRSTIAALNSLGVMLRDRGKVAEAGPYLAEALEHSRSALGNTHATTIASMQNHGFQLRLCGKPAQAEPLYREALATLRRTLGNEHQQTMVAANNLGALLISRGDYAAAEPLVREALAMRRKLFGERHVQTLTSINNVGYVLAEQGKTDEAERFYREAMTKAGEFLGPDSAPALLATNNLGCLLRDSGKLGEARELLRTALEIRRRQHGDAHQDTAVSFENVGILCEREGRLAEAEAAYRQALNGAREVFPDGHPITLRYLQRLGAVLRDEQKADDAEACFREWTEAARRANGDDHPATVQAIIGLCSLWIRLGRYRDACDLLTATEPAARRVLLQSRASRLATFLSTLGRARIGLATPAEFQAAEANLLEANSLLRDARDADRDALAATVRALADLYTAWAAAEPGKGHEDSAAEWNKRL